MPHPGDDLCWPFHDAVLLWQSRSQCARVPGFDEKARTLNAISFAFITILASGISMYAMALVFKLMLGWSMHATIILLSALVVLVYTALGRLTSSIYNEVLQFFLIVLGILPLAILSVSEAGGWSGMAARLPPGSVHTWKGLGNAQNKPMGIEWFGMECWSRSTD